MSKLWYGHFDSTEEDARELTAEDFAAFTRALWTDGVRNGGTTLQVTADSGLKLKLDAGDALVQGYAMSLSEDVSGRYYPIELETAHPSLPRIDRVVLRLDRTIAVRKVTPEVLLGTAGASPAPPALTRNNNIWELSLAQVRVNPGAMNITSANITDERMDDGLCGLINSKLGLDSSAWQARFDEFLLAMKGREDEFLAEHGHRFDTQLETQQTDFDTQLSGQESDYLAFKAVIDAWRDLTVAQLAAQVSFYFDNQTALPGTVKTMTQSANVTTSQIRTKSGDILVAERVMTNNWPTNIITIQKVYDPATGALLSNRKSTLTLVGGLPRTEVIDL